MSANPEWRAPHVCCAVSGLICSLADSQSEMMGAKPKCSPLQVMSSEDRRSGHNALNVDRDRFRVGRKLSSKKVSRSPLTGTGGLESAKPNTETKENDIFLTDTMTDKKF